MRTTLVALALAAAGGLSACAAGMGGESRYDSDLRRLEADCRARGGILTQTGATTGRPQTEYACEITGQPSGRTGG